MKTAYDCSHVKSVEAYALLFGGKFAGKIIANYSDNPNGAVCTASIGFWAGPLKACPYTTGRAGGYGYDKLSAAPRDALDKVKGQTADPEQKGQEWGKVSGIEHGAGNHESALRKLGYEVLSIC